jgi:hypothetical protein
MSSLRYNGHSAASQTVVKIVAATAMTDVSDKKNPTPGAEPRDDDIALGIQDESAIPKGTLDPVYEAKARVLNRAVCIRWAMSIALTSARFKILAWDGINGNCLLSSA